MYVKANNRGEKQMPTALEDKDAIREVFAQYCFTLDNYRFADMAALFTEDGTWDTAFGKATGREAIAALMKSISKPEGERERRIHMVSNVVITLRGDAARVQSNWEVIQNGPDGPHLSSAGGYEDQMVRQNGGWMFQYRKIDRFIK